MTRAQTTLLLTTLILGLLTIPAVASNDVLGEWVAIVEARRGSYGITMEFEAGDDGLAGTFTGRDGVEELRDVVYSDGALTFTRDTESQGGAATLSYTATVDGDTMSLTVETPRGQRSFTAQRID